MTEILTATPPQDWNLHRLGQVFDNRKEKASDKDFDALSVTMQGIVPQLETAAKTDDGDNRKLVRKGDYVINSRSDRKGSGGISPLDGTVSLISIVLKPRHGIVSEFAHHLLRSPAFQEEFYRWGHGIVADLWTTRYSDMKNIRFFLPDLPTQKQIAAFLDCETARIDALIAKQERTVFTLKEYRAALITAAVTGHVERGGCMSDMKLRHLADICNSNVDKVILPDEQPIRLCNYVDVYKNDFIKGDMDFNVGSATPAEIERFHVKVGDVIITKDSEDRHDIGIPAYVLDTDADIVCGYHLTMLRAVKGRTEGAFLFWALQSKPAREAFAIAANGVTRYGLTQEGIKGLVLWTPDLQTQKQIAAFLDCETARIDALIAKKERTVFTLKEYRAALITAAVTGQIDVDTYGKAGATSATLDRIEHGMQQ